MAGSGKDPSDTDWDEIEQMVMEGNDTLNPANHEVDDPDGPWRAVQSLVFGTLKSRDLIEEVIHPDLLARINAGSRQETIDQLRDVTGESQIYDLDIVPLAQSGERAAVRLSNRDRPEADSLDFVLVRDPEAAVGNAWRVTSIAARPRD